MPAPEAKDKYLGGGNMIFLTSDSDYNYVVESIVDKTEWKKDSVEQVVILAYKSILYILPVENNEDSCTVVKRFINEHGKLDRKYHRREQFYCAEDKYRLDGDDEEVIIIGDYVTKNNKYPHTFLCYPRRYADEPLQASKNDSWAREWLIEVNPRGELFLKLANLL